jgi:hypothetical protein
MALSSFLGACFLLEARAQDLNKENKSELTKCVADVYSYAEDDTVEDPLLADHLAHFGIDFSSLRKVSLIMLVSLEIACLHKVLKVN